MFDPCYKRDVFDSKHDHIWLKRVFVIVYICNFTASIVF